MTRRALATVAGGLLVLCGLSFLQAQQPQADVILSNGKIVTVDERFTIAQAVAVAGDRIVAVGTNQDVSRLAGPSTRRIDLRGRTVLPGLIDNHMHLLRYGTTWKYEVRWDGVATRKAALDLLRARTSQVKAGEWIYNLGGWAVEQFSDDAKPFTREELDKVAPDHPVFLQASYYEAYLNSRALQALGIDQNPGANGVVKDAAGRPTGRISEEGFRALVNKLPTAEGADLEASSLGMIKDLNRSGLTAFGSAGCEADVLPIYRRWADQGQLNVRVFCITSPGGGGNPDAVTQLLPRIAQMKLFQGDSYINHHAYGEGVYGALSDPMFRHREQTRAQDLEQWRRITMEIAKHGLPLHVHTNFTETIDAFLDQIEAVDKEYPIRNLRWALAHVNQINASQLERMKKLGMYAAVHPWAVINGAIMHEGFGHGADDMPPLATIQRSGITWGLGSDGTAANQFLPMTALAFAVTGKMAGGLKVINQTIDREDALIAYTRKNAYFVFRENDLGSIQPGKLADLVVLDRDYLTVPADQIKDLRPVMTVVGGKLVYDSVAETQGSRQ